jgi:hypothetical protein
MQNITERLSVTLAPIVAENARRVAAEGPKPSQPKRKYDNIGPIRDPQGRILCGRDDAN